MLMQLFHFSCWEKKIEKSVFSTATIAFPVAVEIRNSH